MRGGGAGDGVAPAGEQTDEFLARAVIAALTEGMSWEQIATRLGVPRPFTAGGSPTEQDWQNAIVAHENARAGRIRAEKCPFPSDPPPG
ncbi:hypothetical protein JWS13_04140 (plasmid) [Rhodococcus pseudokoreensis]|uniref:Helix-turn-helix domain-containing protein n=1 Tax=Rhodococcus pseudokoreensis TaxID=2811421 RepID=A0A974ZRU7_9NOCA|nr:hypothetical protein [Rhodococcus pseudokoreensis]QSE87906.1 hypothetical protein JWS13_04140 [Rhodococcus pseudokoreensis]